MPGMRGLPSGTVTFLFTDVEGSTRLLHELGPERYAEALLDHRRVVRGCCSRHGGVEVDTQGDAFFVAFPSAPAAVSAAADVQRELADGPIDVRIGLHTGRPHIADESYVGEDVHLGARVAAVGHGGQVLLTAQTLELVEADVTELGEHRLKDFEAPVALFQLGDRRFPPLRTVANTNLPRPASSFLGREREVTEIVALVREGARLLSLTGPGGTGKTRLALEAASELVGEFKAGLFWVPLAPIRDPRLVTETIGQTIGAADGLAGHIGTRELMLLLDNLEQVVEVAPELASLVETCPNLRLLVTSRELLRVRGELEYPVPPLAQAEAVELFCARSRLRADETIAQLCRRLDNLPLAVELAAARTGIVSPSQILDRVSHRLDLLRGGRDADARQRTLRATIEWSHDLLTREEQQLFARLSVFVGGCTLDAAEAVAGADWDTLQSLLDKSLLRHSAGRFWMLETIREFAVDRLESTEDAASLRRRHAEHFLAVAETAQLTFRTTQHHPERVAADIDNLRSAIEWALSSGDRLLATRLAVAVEMLWVYTNPSEGLRWYDSLLDGAEALPLELRAELFRAYGSVANPAGEDALAGEMYQRSLEAYEELGDPVGVSELLMRVGAAAMYRGELELARDLGRRSLEMARSNSQRGTESVALWLVGEAETRLGNPEHGIQLIAESAELAGEIGFTWQRTRMLRRLSDWALEHGDLDEARRRVEESIRLSHELGDRISVVFALARLARIAADSGEVRQGGVIWGAVEAEETVGSLGAWYGERERFAEPLLAHAGAEFDVGREEGRLLSLDEAVALALRDEAVGA